MTLAETRTPPTEQGYTEEELAAVVAAILAGHFMAAVPTGNPIAAISSLLRSLIDLPGTPRASVADEVARLTVAALPERPATSQSSTFASLAYVDNLIYRARYAIAAMRRLEAAIAAEQDAPHGGALEAALLSEDRHFDSHQDAMRLRVAAVKMVGA